MSDLTVGQALGVEQFPVEHQGKTYNCSLLDQRRKGAFESWVKANAFSALDGVRKYLPSEEYAADKAALVEAVAKGAYSFHGERCAAAMATPAGGLALMSILFGVPETQMACLLAENREGFGTAFRAAMAASLPLQSRPAAKGDEAKEDRPLANPFA